MKVIFFFEVISNELNGLRVRHVIDIELRISNKISGSKNYFVTPPIRYQVLQAVSYSTYWLMRPSIWDACHLETHDAYGNSSNVRVTLRTYTPRFHYPSNKRSLLNTHTRTRTRAHLNVHVYG